VLLTPNATRHGGFGTASVGPRRVALNWLSSFGALCSTAPSQFPLHGPLLFAHSTHQSHSLSFDIHTRYRSISASTNHSFAATTCSPQQYIPLTSPQPSIRGETRNAFQGAHDRQPPNAPRFEAGRQGIAERVHSQSATLLSPVRPLDNLDNPFCDPHPYTPQSAKPSKGLVCVHPVAFRPKVRHHTEPQ
jgi:hypothetical protein